MPAVLPKVMGDTLTTAVLPRNCDSDGINCSKSTEEEYITMVHTKFLLLSALGPHGKLEKKANELAVLLIRLVKESHEIIMTDVFIFRLEKTP